MAHALPDSWADAMGNFETLLQVNLCTEVCDYLWMNRTKIVKRLREDSKELECDTEINKLFNSYSDNVEELNHKFQKLNEKYHVGYLTFFRETYGESYIDDMERFAHMPEVQHLCEVLGRPKDTLTLNVLYR